MSECEMADLAGVLEPALREALAATAHKCDWHIPDHILDSLADAAALRTLGVLTKVGIATPKAADWYSMIEEARSREAKQRGRG